MLPSGLIARCAGLVVNPTISGFDKAFKSTQKRDDAIAIWKKFKLRHGLGSESLMPGMTYLDGSSLEKVGSQHYFTLNRGGVYLVQDDPRHMHFGCLYFCPFQLQGAFPADARSALKPFSERGMLSYLYGDYDLYGIVPVDMPEFKTVEQSIIFGTKNLYSEKSREIADFLNRSIGAQMIQHGAQENDPSQSGHADESIDVFWANGDVSEARGRAEIEKLYRMDFHDRKTGAGSSGLVRP